jgi:chemotaxis protein CheD
MSQTHPIGLGEMHVSRDPEDILVCYGLGSCVGLILYDPISRAGGMAHVVLPDSTLGRGSDQPAKFADTAVPALLEEVLKAGGSRSRLKARMAGGARMLNVLSSNSKLDIGARNAEAVRAALGKVGISLTAEDCGGTYGRTVTLFVDSGRVLVSTVGRGEKEL